jgi:hypothetical protein
MRIFGKRDHQAACTRRPTTPTQFRISLAISVDPTDARYEILGCFGRSDRSKLIRLRSYGD